MKVLRLLLFLALVSVALAWTQDAASKVQQQQHHLGSSSLRRATTKATARSLQDTEEADPTTHQDDEEHHHDEEEHGDEEHHNEDEEHHEDEEHGDEEHGDEEHHHEEGDEHAHDDEDETKSSEQSTADESKPWGPAIGAALLVNLVTLTGLVVLIPTLLCGRYNAKAASTTFNERRVHWFINVLIPSFAAGALLATTVFLIMPESILLIGDETGAVEHGDHDAHDHRALREQNPEAQLAWKFGASLLGGFLLPLVLSSVFPHAHEEAQEEPTTCPVCDEGLHEKEERTETASREEEPATETSKIVYPDEASGNDDDEEEVWDSSSRGGVEQPRPEQAIAAATAPVDAEEGIPIATASPIKESMTASSPSTPTKEKPINYQLASSILLGDFFHNFADGIFIGTAFALCDRSVAIAITLATIYHEICQELADYFLLTAHCHIVPWKTLVLNFISGLAVMLGVIVILAIDVNRLATGCILAVSAGVYINVAACECVPRVEKEVRSFRDRGVFLLCFICGAVPIGLVLLNHGHCDG